MTAPHHAPAQLGPQRAASLWRLVDKLDADQVVIATHGYTHTLLAALDRVVGPARGQVIATEPLGE